MHQSSPPSSLPLAQSPGCQYRKTKALPEQVLDHCTVCIEEQLYQQAFSLLTTSLTAGTGSEHEARLPPTQHLALAATLAVHPLLTTRSTSLDKHAAADDALAYLKLVNRLVGPKNAGLDRAFTFGDPDLSSSRTAKRTPKPRPSEPNSDNEDEEPQTNDIRSAFAKKDSLWTNADDFWSVVGWAFNCSVAYPLRWARWKPWLDYMLDVLEDDLETRLPDARRAYEASGDTAAVRESLEECLFARYLAPVGEGRNSKRRLMRAVLADGKKQALAEFGPVWKGETQGPKVKGEELPAKKRRKLDLENGMFGDYFDEESDRESPSSESLRWSRSTTAFSTSRRSRPQSANHSGEGDSEDELARGSDTPTSNVPTSTGLDSLGGPPSLALRKRLLALLSRFCALNPDAFLDTEDLFDLYTEFLRPLPLPIFTSFVLPAKPWLGPNSQASLNQMLLRPLLAGTAPAYDENSLTTVEFERFYAPFAASKTGAVESARVGVCVEGLLRLLWGAGALGGGGGDEGGAALSGGGKGGGKQECRTLREAVEKGIAERRARSEGDGRRRVGMRAVEEGEASKMLEASAERMRVVLDLVEAG